MNSGGSTHLYLEFKQSAGGSDLDTGQRRRTPHIATHVNTAALPTKPSHNPDGTTSLAMLAGEGGSDCSCSAVVAGIQGYGDYR